MKIGKYRSAGTGLAKERNILNNSSRNLVNTSIESISSAIESVYPNFDINNYEISTTDGTKTSQVNSNSTVNETSYIDLQFKIGNFYTEAGYTVEIRNNSVVAIYDNNINVEKQESLVNSRVNNTTTLTTQEIEGLKQQAKQQLLGEYENKITINDNDITYIYYYDINTDKKYIVFSIPNTIGSQDIPSLSINNVKIEI